MQNGSDLNLMKARQTLSALAGANDNARSRKPQIVFNGPVTVNITLKKTDDVPDIPLLHRQNLTSRRRIADVLLALPPADFSGPPERFSICD